MTTYVATIKGRDPVTFTAWSDEAALARVRHVHRVMEVFRATEHGYERIAA